VLLAVALALYDAAGDSPGALQLASSEALPKSPLGPAPSARATLTEYALACANARLALLRGRPATAVPGMVRWKRFLDLHGCVYEALSAGLLLTRLHHGAGDVRAAQRELRPVLNNAQRLGLCHLLLDEGRGLSEPLEHYARAGAGVTGETPALALHILEELAPDSSLASVAPRSASPQPTEGLAAREVEVLNLAGQGLRNQDIALTLGLSENTVKWHLKQVYAKLAVSRRAEAVRRARSAGLIS
jgi:LuxR family transcriptional regulator, maltose regulon positive regulatory protein